MRRAGEPRALRSLGRLGEAHVHFGVAELELLVFLKSQVAEERIRLAGRLRFDAVDRLPQGVRPSSTVMSWGASNCARVDSGNLKPGFRVLFRNIPFLSCTWDGTIRAGAKAESAVATKGVKQWTSILVSWSRGIVSF